MKVCIVGSKGHYYDVLKACNKISFIAYCPSYTGEDIGELKRGLDKFKIKNQGFDEYHDMIEKVMPDIIVINGIFSENSKMARYALEKNIYVYCEKPLATSLEQLKMLESTYNSKSVLLWPMLTSRYDPWFYTAKRLVEKGTIGEIRLVTGQKSYKLGSREEFYKNRETYGGTIPWVAIHSIDLILWITQKKCLSVYACHNNYENFGHKDLETISACTLLLENNTIAQVTADYYRPETAKSHGDDRIRIVGTKGILEVRNEKVYLINEDTNGVEEMSIMTPPLIFEDFIEAVSGNMDVLIKPQDGIYSTLICLKARESADLHKEVKV